MFRSIKRFISNRTKNHSRKENKEENYFNKAKKFLSEKNTEKALKFAKSAFQIKQSKKNKELIDKILSDISLVELLAQAEQEEKNALAEALKVDPAQELHAKLLSLAKKDSYKEILEDILAQLKIEHKDNDTIINLEIKFREAIIDLYEKLNEKKKDKLLKNINEKLRKENFAKEITAAGLMLGIKSLGFAPYLASTTAIGALSSAVGVTLPFAFYTFMTASISVLLGPIGWSLLAIFALIKFRKIKQARGYSKLIQSVFIISLMRRRLGRVEYKCQVNSSHEPAQLYMLMEIEGQQEADRLKLIVFLCESCQKKLQSSRPADKEYVLKSLYDIKKDELNKLQVEYEDLLDYYHEKLLSALLFFPSTRTT